MQADFRIALTGTPIENSTADLWAIMDQVTPGALGTLRDFRATYGTPTDTNMTELHARVFHQQGALPPLGLRRMKEAVARDLPRKERRIHPSVMPARQAAAYEDARVKMAGGGRGAALKMLHHIRSVSVHPALDDPTDGPAFIDNSARLERTFAILDGIHARGERALVFIENLKMQYRFAEITRRRFAMERVDIINGSTPIPRRQEIVNRFQQHLITDRGFDLLVLGPRAAGTGLTLTAATHVIHLSRWWNPAVEEQCNDRIHRLGQTRPVTIHMPMAIHPDYREQSFDCLLQSLMQRKRNLAAAALWPMADTGSDATELQNMINNVASTSGGNPVEAALAGMFARDGLPLPALEADGSRVVG
jgi:SNF2 family DNA or RNA helicase